MDNSDFQKQVLKHERFRSTMSGLQTGMSVLQTAAAAHMSRQLAEMRQQNADALAMQQQSMEREQLQAEIEEFVYSTQKILDSYDEPNCNVGVVERFVGIGQLLNSVNEWGLGTPMIRGRENKAAFEKMLRHAEESYARLEQEPEVKKAIAQANAEQARLEQEQEARLAKVAARKSEIERQIGTLSQQRWTLGKDDFFRQNDVDQDIENVLNGHGLFGKFLRFSDWFTHGFVWLLYGFVWIPIAFVLRKDRTLDARQWYRLNISSHLEATNRKIVPPIVRWFWTTKYEAEKNKLEVERNRDVDEQIAALRQEFDSIAKET